MAKAKNKKAKEKASQKFFLNQMFDKSFDEQDKIDELEGIMPLSDFEFKGRVPEAFPIWRCPNINLFTGGGILHIGKIVCAWGKEDCGKTLLAKMITLSALRQQIEVIYRDHEKKLSNTKLNYEQFNLTYEEVFGADPYTKERIKGIRRLVHVTQPTNGHQTFRSMRKRLRGLPHKKFFKGKWYLGFNTKIAKQKEKLEVILANEKKAKFKFLKLDKKVKFGGSKYKWYEILPDENGWVDDRPQALYIIDSIVTMLPEAFDEDDDKEAIREESGGQMNQAAIMFGGEHGWAYITGAAANKHVGIYCTNQLREKPGVTYGSPEYMPGGNATHQSQNARYRARKASIAMGMEKRTLFKGGMNKINQDNYLIEEPSVEFPGGSDHYKWSKLTTEKNHSYTPPTKHMTFRIWLKDGDEKEATRGIDPVWEYYMSATNIGLIKRPARQDHITFLDKKLIWADKEKWTWLEFKALILLEGDDKKSAKKYLRKMNLVPEKPVEPKKLKGMKTKKAQEKYAKALKQHKKKLTIFKEKYAKVKKRCKGFNFKNYIDRLIDNGKAFPKYGATVSRKQVSGGDDD